MNWKLMMSRRMRWLRDKKRYFSIIHNNKHAIYHHINQKESVKLSLTKNGKSAVCPPVIYFLTLVITYFFETKVPGYDIYLLFGNRLL